MNRPINRYIAVYILIALITIAANFPLIFLYKSMFLDDMGRYVLGLEERLHPSILRQYPLAAYLMDIAHRLMVHSLVYARLYMAILFALSNMTLFYIFNRLLKFPVLLSLVAAVFPAILPGQAEIPAFIAGSYTVPGSLFLFLSILFAHKYIERESDGRANIALFSVMYIASILIMLNSLFYFLPMTLIFLSFNHFKLSKRIKHLLSIVILANAIKALYHLSATAYASQTAVELSGMQIYVRIIKSIFYLFPIGVYSILSWMMTGIFVVFVTLGLIGWLRANYQLIKAKQMFFAETMKENFPVWLGIVWIISGSIVFWFKSPYFSDRYFNLVSYGSGLLVSFFVLNALHSCKSAILRKSGSIALMLLVLLMISSKIHWQHYFVSGQNYAYSLYKNELMKFDYPQESQIVVVGRTSIQTDGYWLYSSGFLKYLIGRADVEGNISYPEMQFYNPFDPSQRGFSTHMTGVDLEKPVFLFRKAGNHLYSVKYALQWESSSWSKGIPGNTYLGAGSAEELIRSPWKIYEFNLVNGENSILKSGEGIDGYYEAINDLSRIGIAEKEILWAGPMNKRTKTRFGLN